ncbi:MAG: hypothetical protein R2800_14930 [Flavipsychrobacter sp.]
MKYILSVAIILSVAFAACKKDSFSYTCKCVDATKQRVDTFINYQLPTSGEAYYECRRFQDTANKYGRPYECDLTK